jgi:hypothetical protein
MEVFYDGSFLFCRPMIIFGMVYAVAIAGKSISRMT